MVVLPLFLSFCVFVLPLLLRFVCLIVIMFLLVALCGDVWAAGGSGSGPQTAAGAGSQVMQEQRVPNPS